ncbi:MAG: DUF58 domain-containing protein [Chloroflexi bacterium]|nr:DUF58 domain-containing protein [Chloroflexota bacterium]
MASQILFLLVLLGVAALYRVDFFFYILYLMSGSYLLSRWWSRHSLGRLACERQHHSHAFLGEQVPVTLVLTNRSALPIPWVRIHDSLPVALSTPNFYSMVLSLGGHEERQLAYSLSCNRRGLYFLGPLTATGGDIFGFEERSLTHAQQDTLIVYPEIVPLERMSLPSRAPYVTISSPRQIFEDPARISGVRNYMAGDSLRRIHWTISAHRGELVIKKYQQAIAQETAIFLDLDQDLYHERSWYVAVEQAIVMAASLANYEIGQRQPVGLYTNGLDPLAAQPGVTALPPHKSQAHLMRLLEILARIESRPERPTLARLVQQFSPDLSWGTTVAIIAGERAAQVGEILLSQQKAGLAPVLFLVIPPGATAPVVAHARLLGVPVFRVWENRMTR